MFEFLKGGMKVSRYGTLLCPGCKSRNVKCIEEIGNYITRWKCKECNLTFRYDQTPHVPFKSKQNPKGYDPYASFKRGIKIPR
jgi:transposase-like protein